MNNDVAVRLSHVNVDFRGNQVFHDANLELKKGLITGIQGPNGSGKSVLFKLICGFQDPGSGEIEIDPRYYAKTSDKFPANVGVIIDRPAYLPMLTGLENLIQLASVRKIIGEKEALRALERVGLSADIKQRVRNYSLGMRQRLAVAQAFMESQQLLLLDEAFNGLDVEGVNLIRELLVDLKNEGRTIVITSHNQDDIDAVCDEVYKIEDRHFERVR